MPSPLKQYFPQVLICAMLLHNCSSIHPLPPPLEFNAENFVPDISNVNIPVELSMEGMEKSINKNIQGLLYEDNDLENNGQDNLLLKVWKQDNISIDVAGNEVLYKVPLKIWAKGGFKIKKFGINFSNYQEGNCAIALRFKSKVSIDSLWNVQTKTVIDGYDWIEKPVLKFGAIEMPVTYIADLILKTQQSKLAQAMDEQARSALAVRPVIEKAWKKIQIPLQVSHTPEIWLSIKPIGIHMLPFFGKTRKLNASIGITALVETVFEKRPDVIPSPLPNLKFSDTTDNNISISLVNEIGYTSATMLLNQNLAGQKFYFKDGRYIIKINNVDLYPSKNKLTARINVEGSLNGTLFLQGIPYYDPLSMSLKWKETEFSINTRNGLLKTASWMLKGNFEKKIEENFSYPLKEILLQYKDIIQANLKNKQIDKYLNINGEISYLEPDRIILTPEALKVVVNAKGKLQLYVDGFD